MTTASLKREWLEGMTDWSAYPRLSPTPEPPTVSLMPDVQWAIDQLRDVAERGTPAERVAACEAIVRCYVMIGPPKIALATPKGDA